jgi:hypothetical protein
VTTLSAFKPTLDDDIRAMAQRELARRAPKLADTVPPIEPPAQATVTYGKAHDLVVWHDKQGTIGCRVSKTRYATKEAALLAYNAVSYATAYKAAVYDGRELVASRTLAPPADQLEHDARTLLAWNKQQQGR